MSVYVPHYTYTCQGKNAKSKEKIAKNLDSTGYFAFCARNYLGNYSVRSTQGQRGSGGPYNFRLGSV
jgi:hypothetical protein